MTLAASTSVWPFADAESIFEPERERDRDQRRADSTLRRAQTLAEAFVCDWAIDAASARDPHEPAARAVHEGAGRCQRA